MGAENGSNSRLAVKWPGLQKMMETPTRPIRSDLDDGQFPRSGALDLMAEGRAPRGLNLSGEGRQQLVDAGADVGNNLRILSRGIVAFFGIVLHIVEFLMGQWEVESSSDRIRRPGKRVVAGDVKLPSSHPGALQVPGIEIQENVAVNGILLASKHGPDIDSVHRI